MAQVSKNLQNPFEKGEESEGADETPDAPEGEGGVVVPLRGPDDEDDEDDESDASAQPRPETARQRRTNRYKEQKEGRERAERERDELRSALERERAQYARPAAAPQGPDLDTQYKRIKDDVYEKRRLLSKQYNDLVSKGALTEDLEKMLWERQRELNTAETRADMEYARLSNPANHPGHQEVSQERQATVQWLRMNHSDVVAHPNGQAIGMFAMAEEARLIANGAPKDFSTAEKAMQAAKLHFGLTKRPAPSARTRAAYSGGTSSAGAGGGAPNGGAPTSMTLTKAHQDMAEARFPELKAADAHKKWANTVGRKVLENREAKRRA